MQAKLIVLDDDPTGSQTVHSCLLLTRWDAATLKLGLNDASPLMFVLTNTRALPQPEARAVIRQVCLNLKPLLAEFNNPYLVISRSDSTLRGHYPLETEVISEVLGPFDAHFLIPAFFEGGRFTEDGMHYVQMGDKRVPAHQTEFAKDSVFGYSNAFLPAYVEEKTQGRIKAAQVARFNLNEIRSGALAKLMSLSGNVCCVVDAVSQADLNLFARDLERATQQGKRFLFRSAASLLTALAQLPPQPVAGKDMATYVKARRPGVVVVGSHVKKSTEQLTHLLKEPGIEGLEIDVDAVTADIDKMRAATSQKLEQIHKNGRTPVIYTTREERHFDSDKARLEFGKAVSRFLVEVVKNLPQTIGFIISKGGITSNDVLSAGLEVRAARVAGQIIPGCNLVLTPANHPRFPALPVVIFPGNVGEADGLATVYRSLRGS